MNVTIIQLSTVALVTKSKFMIVRSNTVCVMIYETILCSKAQGGIISLYFIKYLLSMIVHYG